MRRALIWLTASLVFLGGCDSGPAGAGTSAAPASPREGGVSARHGDADTAFVRALIPHHQAGIGLASALAEATPQARTLASAVIATQQDEVVRMSGWLRAWGAGQPPSVNPSAPPSAGPDPVRAFIAHQEQAIKLAQQEQANGTNPEALAFARQIVESRTGQIIELEKISAEQVSPG
ncbi:DUF305 domain-containing protein [Actinoplanes sp. LDG1-06]|uniref:DUF305 domain-containing protein n=1 Tax=Paractinoplanes ovalisporus TaxID=2810368 RepID=A0ABS2ANH7_9ACTN|nr:DUF305 domain-containing protein [Actinoplanes ovalisporus]MBM2621386.1 DUF305 domain-containing protein [Actinoplanes ovalisporus]